MKGVLICLKHSFINNTIVRMKKIQLIVFLMIFIFSSCDNGWKLNEQESTFNYSSFKNNEKLIFKELNQINGVAYRLGSYDSLLLIQETGKHDVISIYSKNTGEFITSELSIGKGPNEVIASFGHGVINDSIFWSYEGETTTIRFYHINDILNVEKAKIFETNHVELERYAYKIVPLSMDTFLLTGCPSYKSKLTIINNKGVVLDSIGKYYNIPFDDFTFLKYAYMYLLSIKPDKKALVLGYYFTDVIEIYSIDGKLIKAIHGPENFDVDPKPSLKNMSQYFVQSQKTRYAYVEIRATDNNIYALFDGDSANDPSPNGKYIFVFDWEGEPVKSFELSVGISNFVVDEKNKKIYASSYATGNLIYAYFEI